MQHDVRETHETPATDTTPTRRHVITAGAATVAAVGVGSLAACGSSSSATSTGATTPAAAGAASLSPLSAVAVGKAIAAKGPDGKPIVIAQPAAGTVVAFSTICTHAGCPTKLAGTELDCPCHGSKFNALTGAVINGPASAPLAAVTVKVSGSDIVAG